MFELQVVSNTPMNAVDDINIVAETFLTDIGYLPRGYDPKTSATTVRDSIPYRIFMDCFMRFPAKVWVVEEIAAMLGTTKPTVYRHVNKLKAIDLLEAMDTEYDGVSRRGYRVRFGDLAKAWNFTISNVNMAMDNYTKTVGHLQKLVIERNSK